MRTVPFLLPGVVAAALALTACGGGGGERSISSAYQYEGIPSGYDFTTRKTC